MLSVMESSSAEKALPVQIRIHLDGGLVHRVEVSGLDPVQVNAEVFDYDIEGIDDDAVTELPGGAAVCIDHPPVELLDATC